MPVLSTTISGTHTNIVQAAAVFETRVIQSPATAVVVEVTVRRYGKPVDHNDFVLDAQHPAHEISVGASSVTLSGRLKLDENDRIVVFQGSLTFPDQVQVIMEPAVVAVLA